MAAAIVAFSTVVSGGFIPHAKQGGSGVDAVAVAGSKLDGTGLENEHMGQTHVAFTLCAGVGELFVARVGANALGPSWLIMRLGGLA